MSIRDIQNVLKNMSGDELAQAQNAVLMADDLPKAERTTAIQLISQELTIRKNEGWERKTERFVNRHGKKVGLVALGALLGIGIDDII